MLKVHSIRIAPNPFPIPDARNVRPNFLLASGPVPTNSKIGTNSLLVIGKPNEEVLVEVELEVGVGEEEEEEEGRIRGNGYAIDVSLKRISVCVIQNPQ